MSRKKGSPKTGGKKKGSKHKKTLKQEEAIKYIQDTIRKDLGPVLIALITKCKAGDMSAIREALDRLVGKPKESLDLTSGGKALPTPIIDLSTKKNEILHSNSNSQNKKANQKD